MKKKILLITTIFIVQFSIAQVLLTEDFNSYAPGHLNTDYTGTTAGQGGWVTKRHANAIATAMVTPETGKGNVITFTTNGTFSNESVGILQNIGIINALWNNRTVGNNVLKYEYEVYGTSFFNAYGSILNNNLGFMALRFASTTGYFIEAFHTGSSNTQIILKNYTAVTFPYNTWHKVELFIDYNTLKAYFYIPTLNLFRVDTIHSTKNRMPDNIYFSADWLKPSTIVKYDNIKLTALQTVPAYILSANEIVSAKFNMYPNPATNVVNITNSENMLVQQVIIYDISGKQLSTQSFNNEVQIQLNVENLPSGTYMLHIQTNAGTAVKKLVKK